jgi:hypothetical protein
MKRNLFPISEDRFGVSIAIPATQSVNINEVKLDGKIFTDTWTSKTANAPSELKYQSVVLPLDITPGDHVLSIALQDPTSSSDMTFTIPDVSTTARICIYGDLPVWYQDDLATHPYAYESLVTSKNEFDMIIHLGDIAYNFSQLGNDFQTLIDPISSSKPYTFIAGNHEYRDGSYTPFMTAYQAQLEVADDKLQEIKDSAITDLVNLTTGNHIVKIGSVAFILMNNAPLQGNGGAWDAKTVGVLDQGIPLLKSWFSTALASIDKAQTPWIATCGHRPFWWDALGEASRFIGDMNGDAALNDFVQLYNDNVDFHFCGHAHLYARSESPNNTFTRTTQILSGSMGRSLDNIGTIDQVTNMATTKYNFTEYGYGIFECNKTAAKWTFYGIAEAATRATIEPKKVLDEVCWIKTENDKQISSECQNIFNIPTPTPTAIFTFVPPITTPTVPTISPTSTPIINDNTGLKDWEIVLIAISLTLVVIGILVGTYFATRTKK